MLCDTYSSLITGLARTTRISSGGDGSGGSGGGGGGGSSVANRGASQSCFIQSFRGVNDRWCLSVCRVPPPPPPSVHAATVARDVKEHRGKD